jgi:hypothetical protein
MLDPDRTITVGAAFGQVLVDRAGLEWVSVSDKHGKEICVAVPGKQSFCAPLSTVDKRIARGEYLSIAQFYEDTLALLREQNPRYGVGARLNIDLFGDELCVRLDIIEPFLGLLAHQRLNQILEIG